jgi:hypothetical protein
MGGGFRQQLLQDEARCHAAKALLVSLCTRRPRGPLPFPKQNVYLVATSTWGLNPFHPWTRHELCQTSYWGSLAHNNNNNKSCFGFQLGPC